MLIVSLVFSSGPFYASEKMAVVDTSGLPASLLNLWRGEWDVVWEGAKGERHSGINRVGEIGSRSIIQEHFEALDAGTFSGLKGVCFSKYNGQTRQWHQAWHDNQGGYYDFVGAFDRQGRIFTTKIVSHEGNISDHRLVFKYASRKSILWDWEIFNERKHQWMRSWRMQYRKLS